MRLLLDTHALVWWFEGNTTLTITARAAIDDRRNQTYVSAASVWEIATKHRLGKLAGNPVLIADIPAAVASQGFLELPVTLRHGQAAGALAIKHKDPFDRMLVAQAMLEALVLVSNERAFDSLAINRLW
jgi:PIN domain nuclease of toxin-antitoxin system